MTTKRRNRKQRRAIARAQCERVLAAFGDEGVALLVDPSATCEISAAAGSDEGSDNGPPRVDLLAYSGGLLRVDGFDYPVVVDIPTLQANGEQTPLLLTHDSKKGVGHVNADSLDMSDGRTIKAAGVISHENEHASQVLTAHRNGFRWQPSIGARINPKQTRLIKPGQKIRANGREFEGPVIYARGARLGEISFVPRGGDEAATAAIAAAHTQGDTMDPELREYLEAAGFSAEQIDGFDEATLAVFALQMEAAAGGNDDATLGDDASDTLNAAGGADDLVAEIRANAAAEATRIAEIQALCREHDNPSFESNGETVTVEAHAIGEGWDTVRTELQIRREQRSPAPAGHSHSHESSCTVQAMQGAALVRSGVSLDAPILASAGAVALGLPSWLRRELNDDTRQQIMEAAHAFGSMSLVDQCREAVRLDGGQVSHGREAMIHAAMSGGTLSSIWTTNVNARMLQGFGDEPDTTGGFTRATEVNDFKSNERFRLIKAPRLSRHARGGEAEHGSRDDRVETFKIARYSEQFQIDDMDVIDDSFGALQDTPFELGQAAAMLRPDLVYSILLANAAMGDGTALFHADHSNLNTSAALTGPNLGAAIEAMMLQSENGRNLNLAPSHLITPVALKHTALQILNSAEVRGSGASETDGTTNVFRGAVDEAVCDSRLDNGVTDPTDGTVHAGSSTTWFTASRRRAPIEVATRTGTGGAPSVDSWSKNGEDGKWIRGWAVKHDIGAKAVEWLTAQKNTA